MYIFVKLYQFLISKKQKLRIFIRKRTWEKYYHKLLIEAGGGYISDIERIKVNRIFDSRFIKGYTSHKFYKITTGKFDEKYIPDPIYFSYIDPFFNDWNLAKVIDNKCWYQKIFPSFRHPKTIVTRQNGFWFDSQGKLINEEEAISLILLNKNSFLKKATESEGGRGVYYIDESFNYEKILLKINSFQSDMIVQKEIKQSAVLSQFNSCSVNTIRLFTLLKKDGKPKIYSACLRMGINGSKVDNASSGGIVVGINEDGSLKKYAYSNKGQRFAKHPSSNINFDSVCIPNYDKIKNIILNEVPLHPHFRQISWDICLDEHNEPILIEVNLRMGEIDFLQMCNGPLYGDDTLSILNEVFSSK